MQAFIDCLLLGRPTNGLGFSRVNDPTGKGGDKPGHVIKIALFNR
jgi:hypothetical protein